MSKRRHDDAPVLSLDSFLDIVTNVVGVLILVAVVTVLGTGDIGVSAGATALAAPRPTADRALFHCAGGELFFVDEKGNAKRLQSQIGDALREKGLTAEAVTEYLDNHDLGDATHRVRAESGPGGLAWVYRVRPGVHGEDKGRVGQSTSAFQRRLDELPAGGFAYFVVDDDSFEVFRAAREVAAARGIAVGWSPQERGKGLRLGAMGSLGKRVQ